MSRKGKVLTFNGILLALNIYLFGFVLNFGSSFWGTIGGVGLIIADLIAILAEIVVLVATSKDEPAETIVNANNLQTEEEFKSELMKNMMKREFKSEAELAIRQMERLKKKIESLDKMLTQHFVPGSLTYEKFSSTVINIENLFYDNLRKMINKMSIFDQDAFNNMARQNRIISTEAQQERNAIFKEYIDYVKSMLERNEQILIKLDNLMLEISKLGDDEEVSIENIDAVEDIDELIEQTKLYKQAQQ